MTDSEPRRGSRFGLTLGLAGLGAGLWLLLHALGVGVPSFKTLWPTLLILAGAASLFDLFYLSRRPASAGLALAWVGFGVLAFALTLGHTNWRRVLDWLPSFPTIIGLSFFATWLAGKRRSANLPVVGGVLLGLGIMASRRASSGSSACCPRRRSSGPCSYSSAVDIWSGGRW